MKEVWGRCVLRESVMKRLWERKGEGWWREQGGRNQSASHYLLSGALQQRDEIIKNPIAALWEGMTERREIHIWTGQSNRSPFRHVDTLTFGQTLTAPSDPHMLKGKVGVQQSEKAREGRIRWMSCEWKRACMSARERDMENKNEGNRENSQWSANESDSQRGNLQNH